MTSAKSTIEWFHHIEPTNPKVIIDKLLVEGIIIIDYSPRVVPLADGWWIISTRNNCPGECVCHSPNYFGMRLEYANEE